MGVDNSCLFTQLFVKHTFPKIHFQRYWVHISVWFQDISSKFTFVVLCYNFVLAFFNESEVPMWVNRVSNWPLWLPHLGQSQPLTRLSMLLLKTWLIIIKDTFIGKWLCIVTSCIFLQWDRSLASKNSDFFFKWYSYQMASKHSHQLLFIFCVKSTVIFSKCLW